MRLATLLAVLAAATLALALPAASSAKTVWLCQPGMKHNPCAPGLGTSVVNPATGKVLRTEHPKMARNKRVDCFYVYPTVSDQKGLVATRRIDPEERSIARFQAARYGQDCRVFAPMYRQVTLRGIGSDSSKVTKAMRQRGLADVVAAWKLYLRRDNHGRGVIFIGHSQGSFVLRQFLAQQIDPSRTMRRRLVGAFLLGGNVLVRQGRATGGDFKHIGVCRRRGQIGCVVAFSTFGAKPPSNAIFGRATPVLGTKAPKHTAVACTNPATLAGTSPKITPIFPSVPFAPGSTIGVATELVGFPIPKVRTPWITAPNAYRATCTPGAIHVLRISPLGGAPRLTAIPDATWGLHLTDANIALGQLVTIARTQTNNWVARTAGQGSRGLG